MGHKLPPIGLLLSSLWLDRRNPGAIFFHESVDIKSAKSYICRLKGNEAKKSVMDNVNVIRTGFFALDFTLTDTQGDLFHLTDNLDGHFTCLVFFSEGDIEKINGYLKTLNQGLPEVASGLPVNIIAICPEKVGHLRQLKEKLRLNFPILSDPRMIVSRRYYVVNESSARPAVFFSIFIVDDSGVIRYRLSEMQGLSKFMADDLKTAISGLI